MAAEVHAISDEARDFYFALGFGFVSAGAPTQSNDAVVTLSDMRATL
jgi:hypothetical protein